MLLRPDAASNIHFSKRFHKSTRLKVPSSNGAIEKKSFTRSRRRLKWGKLIKKNRDFGLLKTPELNNAVATLTVGHLTSRTGGWGLWQKELEAEVSGPEPFCPCGEPAGVAPTPLVKLGSGSCAVPGDDHRRPPSPASPQFRSSSPAPVRCFQPLSEGPL